MALFGRDYDRDYGYRGDAWSRGGYDRGYRSGWSNWDRDRTYGSWDRNTPYTGMTRDNRGYGMSPYDRDFGMAGYDRGYKSRWQTDFGDPFGDRTAHTPMRMIRGEYRGGYDRGYWGGNRNLETGEPGYGRDYYEANPMSYDPYTTTNRDFREGTWMRGNDRNYRTSGRGYDTGWF